MTTTQPLVSIVTPVHNGEPYLSECIDSVLNQTYENWTYTVVNNCSTDATAEILESYAARDPRIRLRNTDSCVRVIANYNNAVRETAPEAKYCKLVAADDWIFPECLEKMVALAEEYPSAAIVGAYCLRETDVALTGLPYSKRLINGKEACRSLLLGGPYVFGAASAVLYRADIVRSRHRFYNEDNLHADLEACLEFLEHHDFGFVHQVLTFRRVQEESVTSYSKRVNTYLPSMLEALLKYGPKYLTEEEVERRARQQLYEYYRYLGWEVFKLRGSDFWRYHRGKLSALGQPLSPVRVVTSAIRNALDLALNPKNTSIAAWGRLYRSVSRT